MWLAIVNAAFGQDLDTPEPTTIVEQPREQPDPGEVEPEEPEQPEEPEEPEEEAENDFDTVTVVTDRKPKSERLGDGLLLAFGSTYGAYAGATTGFLIGEVLEDNELDHTTEGILPGLLGGGAIGATTAYVLSRSKSPTVESQGLLFNASLHGIYYGAQVGRAFIPPDDPGRAERIHAAGLAGSMLGVGLGIAFGDRAASLEDQGRFAAASGVGWLTATGINDLAELGVDGSGVVTDDRARAGVAIGTTAVFGGLGALANRTGTRPGPASLALSLGHGAWIGGWSPLLFDDGPPDERRVTGGLRLGVGVGYASSLLMSSFGEPSARSAGMQVAGWAAGSALGAGLPLALADEDAPARQIVGPMLGAGVGGQVLGAALAPRYDLDRDDAILLGTLGAWTTYQAIGWGVYADYTNPNTRKPFGYSLTAAGAGSLVTLGLTPVLDVPPSGSMMLLSAGGWGTWYGAWGGQLADLDEDGQWLTALGAGNGALLVSGAALGAGWRPSWLDIAAIDGLGLVGAAAGGLTGVVFTYDENDIDPLVTPILVGSTLGLATGSVIAALNDDRDLEIASLGRFRLDGWRGSVSAAPLPGRDGSMGGLVKVRFDETE